MYDKGITKRKNKMSDDVNEMRVMYLRIVAPAPPLPPFLVGANCL